MEEYARQSRGIGPAASAVAAHARELLFIVVLMTGAVPVMTQTSSGPRKGSLVAVGGDFKVGTERFVSLAGGPDASFVYIPTAASSIRLPSGFIYEPPHSDTPAANTREFEQELCKLFGVKRITVLHTRSRDTANSKTFVAPLRRANGVWLSYGNAGRLAATYLDTLTQREIEAVLERGGVVGGTSAGAIIQGSYIVRGRPDKPLLMAKGHERGFGFLKNVAINPHLSEQKRETELVNVVDAHPELLGIGLDEKAAIIVQGDQFEVIGEGRVAVYDNQKHGSNWYYWLTPGDSFDLRGRTAKRVSKAESTIPRSLLRDRRIECVGVQREPRSLWSRAGSIPSPRSYLYSQTTLQGGVREYPPAPRRDLPRVSAAESVHEHRGAPDA